MIDHRQTVRMQRGFSDNATSYFVMIKKNNAFSFPEMEREQLDFWQKKDIFKKSLEQRASGKPYLFYDGPPFATGLPHHGHLVGSTLKDIIPRYQTMKGRYVERRFGWDCHGLPIEYEIDKKLGMHALDAVKKLGVSGYNDECRNIVSRYASEWEKTITRIGRWVDFENDYKTMNVSFMESVWWVFQQLWNKDLIYQSNRVLPFSTALGTALSNFEAGMNYRDLQDPCVTVLFKLQDENTFVSAWTTTPWTLPSNLGLCVGEDIDYCLVEELKSGRQIYLSSDSMERYSKLQLKVIKEIKGRALKGKSYQPLFPFFKKFEGQGGFLIHCDNYVTTETGTGIVHLAPGFGEDDNRVMKEAGLEKVFVCPVDDQGRFTSDIPTWAGQKVKEADKEIIRALKEKKILWVQDTIVHSYPLCWRSDTPLIYKAIPSWYVKVSQLRKALQKANEQINWVPGHLKEGRFGNWLANARDWSISRTRTWGTPLPVWYNPESKRHLCIGSIAELKKYTGMTLTDLHREHVDPLTFSIPGESGEYKRITEVFDCWFESGSMPYAQLHYPFENKELFQHGFPAEFIAEGLDQTRGWFYTLTVLSVALYDRPAFKNVIVNGIVAGENGKKMSKRLKNYTAPNVLIEKHGADALRLYLINSGLTRGEDMRFSDQGVEDMVRRTLLPWYNAYKFFSTYASIDGWNKQDRFYKTGNITDHWILSRLQSLKHNISLEMEAYRVYNVVPCLLHFLEDLTNWYIRLNRSRFWGEEQTDLDNKDKAAAYSTLYTCLREFTVSMAPFTPFTSEYLYRELLAFESNISKKESPQSVHLCSYPTAEKSHIDDSLEQAMIHMQQVILLGRQRRSETKLKIKVPLSKLTCIHRDKILLNDLQKLETYIKSELNVKSIEYTTDEKKFVDLTIKPNLPVLGKRLGNRMGKFIKLISKLSSQDIYHLEESGNLSLEGEVFLREDFLIMRTPCKGVGALSNRFIATVLDCQTTPELIREGLAREIVNRIQKTRKDMDLQVNDRISIIYTAKGQLSEAIKAHADYIGGETLAVSLKPGKAKDHTFSIDGESLTLDIALHKKS